MDTHPGPLPPDRYVPPKPSSLSAVTALLRAALHGDGDLLSLLPTAAYRVPIGPLGYSRRQILIVNQPDLVRHVLTDPEGIFPKSDLMVNALAPLIGDSIFVSSGATWQRQRRVIDPALSMMRVGRAYPDMQAGAEACEQTLAGHAREGTAFSLDLAMSHLTADIICRTVFSTGLETAAAHEVFAAFTVFERSVAQVGDPPADHGPCLDPRPAAAGGAGVLPRDPPPHGRAARHAFGCHWVRRHRVCRGRGAG